MRGYEEVIIRKALEGVKVEEVMIREVVTVAPQLTLAELVHDYILSHGYRGFPVVENGRVVGIVSLTEVKEVPRERHPQVRVAEVMLPLDETLVVGDQTSLADAIVQMSREGVERLVVMRQDRMMGMVTKTGLLRFVQLKQILGEPAGA